MFDRWFDLYRWWWCALSGLLLVASFAPFESATCGWIALVPAWWVISRSDRARRQPIRHGYLIGLIYFGGVFWWISNVTAVGTFFLVLYLALYPAIWFLLVARLILRDESATGTTTFRTLAHALSAAALWVLLEWMRSWFLTGFNWNELGISQAPSIIFRQLATYGGVHLISFILVTVNILWAEGALALADRFSHVRKSHAKLGRIDSLTVAAFGTASFALALLIIVGSFAVGVHHVMGKEPDPHPRYLRFVCIQPNVPQIPYSDEASQKAALEKLKSLSVEAISAQAKSDLLIWPEAILDEGVFQDQPLFDAVSDICHDYDGYFLLGSQDYDIHGGRKLYNCAYLFTPGGDQDTEYRKTRLVILGEFLPYGDTFPWIRKKLGLGGIDFTPGPGPVKFEMQKPGISFAPLICFEDTLPEVADKAARLNPDFFITITNDGWYTGWCATWGVRQHLNEAIFRCVEHGRPMIRCANTGISCVVNPIGVVVPYLDASGRDIDTGGIFRGMLVIGQPPGTLYEAWGDWIVLISALIGGILGLRLLRRIPAS